MCVQGRWSGLVAHTVYKYTGQTKAGVWLVTLPNTHTHLHSHSHTLIYTHIHTQSHSSWHSVKVALSRVKGAHLGNYFHISVSLIGLPKLGNMYSFCLILLLIEETSTNEHIKY